MPLCLRFVSFHNFRWVVYFSTWGLLLSLCVIRASFSIANIGQIEKAKKDRDTTCPEEFVNPDPDIQRYTTMYKWDKTKSEVSIFTFNLGYMLGHYPGTMAILAFGTHRVMICVVFGCTILTFLSVFTAPYYPLFLVTRIAIGFLSGCMFPIVNQTATEYAPPKERSVVLMSIHTANLLACAVVFPWGGFLIENFVNGWKWIYVSCGGLGLVFGIIWTFSAFSNPMENPFMSKREQNFITTGIYPNGRPPKMTFANIPHRSILMDKQLALCSLTHFAKLQILYLSLLGAVKHINNFFNESPLKSGLYGVIPFVGESIFQMAYTHLSHYMYRGKVSLLVQRRLNTLIGAFGCSVFLFGNCFVNCNQVAIGVTLLTLSLMCLAPYQGGYFIGIIERFGRYNGYAFSIINIFGSLSGVLQRVVVIVLAVIFPDPRVSIRWSFGITSFISFILSLPYVFLGDCSRAPWVDGQPAKAPLVVADNKSPDEHKRESMESAA